MNFLENYYNNYDEEGRLLRRHGQVEYLTTMHYINNILQQDKSKRILEVGAGTGRYSVTLAKEGYEVDAVELVQHNLDILKSKLDGSEKITPVQGNALDLSRYGDGEFDLVLLLGPMYHLYTKDMKVEREKIIAADGATVYMRDKVNEFDDETFDLWMKYHLAICERMDLIGATNHSLDILKKI